MAGGKIRQHNYVRPLVGLAAFIYGCLFLMEPLNIPQEPIMAFRDQEEIPLKRRPHNVGQYLVGDKIQNSPNYFLYMRREVHCQLVCQIVLSEKDADSWIFYIHHGYRHNWILDRLKSLENNTRGGNSKPQSLGFPLGFVHGNGTFIYNHMNIQVQYNKPHWTDGSHEEGNLIVGFSVEPMSVEHSFANGFQWDGLSTVGYTKTLETCDRKQPMKPMDIQSNQLVEKGRKIIFTYDVTWSEMPHKNWNSRWDAYTPREDPPDLRSYSVTYSLVIVSILGFFVFAAFNKRCNIAKYCDTTETRVEDKKLEIAGDADADTHTKLFQPPSTMPLIFCALIGSGVQFVATLFLFFILAHASGFLDHEDHGTWIQALLPLYMICGFLAGYTSNRMAIIFQMPNRSQNICTLYAATIFSGPTFVIFIVYNIILHFHNSTLSVPVITILIVITMWLFTSLPLVCLGAEYSKQSSTQQSPSCHFHAFDELLHTDSLSLSRFFQVDISLIFAGLIPFSCTLFDFHWIMTSLWLDRGNNSILGFGSFVVAVVLITSGEIAVLLLVHHHLLRTNKNFCSSSWWWWYSFFAAGSVAGWIFLYSVFWFQKLQATLPITFVLYFGFMIWICCVMFLMIGAMGTLSSLWFVLLLLNKC